MFIVVFVKVVKYVYVWVMLYVYVFIYVSGCTCKCLYSGFFVSNRVYVFACVFECGFG
jgi:hypothetical protein